MIGGDIETEPEVTDWYVHLPTDQQDTVAGYIDLLEEYGHMLRMPHSKPLGGGLHELRFHMDRKQWRITYWERADAVIVLLTVFRKQRNNERAEVSRAQAAYKECQKSHQP